MFAVVGSALGGVTGAVGTREMLGCRSELGRRLWRAVGSAQSRLASTDSKRNQSTAFAAASADVHSSQPPRVFVRPDTDHGFRVEDDFRFPSSLSLPVLLRDAFH